MSTDNGPVFDGDGKKYEIWEAKFLGYMKLQKLHDVILPVSGQKEGKRHTEKNADAFAELVLCLDDRSLSLIIRDAKDDGRKALQMLREHYVSKGPPRIFASYTDLTALKKSANETVTDYIFRAENAASTLKTTTGEEIGEGFLIAMILKGLPSEFEPFTTAVKMNEALTFGEFKNALRNFEETQNFGNRIV